MRESNIFGQEGLTVAESLTETTFSETLPSKMERYYYVVTPRNSDGKTGEGAESNRILSGSSFDTPYYDNFSDETTLSLWTIVNVDNDASQYGGEYTWSFSSYNKNFTISTGSYGMGEVSTVSTTGSSRRVSPCRQTSPTP